MARCNDLLFCVAAVRLWLVGARPSALRHFEDLHDAISAASWPSATSAVSHGRQRPRVVPQFSADLLFAVSQASERYDDGVGRISYDSVGQRYRLKVTAKTSAFHINETVVLQLRSANGDPAGMNFSATIGEGKLGVCNPTPRPYVDLFSWASSAEVNGSAVIDGTPCTVLTKDVIRPSMLGNREHAHLSVCVAADGTPLELTDVGHGAGEASFSRYQFKHVEVGPPDERSLAPTWACASNYPAKPCEDTGVETVNAFRLWGPPEPLALADRNTGDIMGDLSFMCLQESGETLRSKLITHWSVQVSRKFGQYAQCNFDGHRNRCFGPREQLLRVGRRDSQVAGNQSLGGQCTTNADTGSQYSFPTEARCPPGVEPSDTGCAWGSAQAKRTVHAACLLEHGLLEACKLEVGHAPFRHSMAVFAAAFASSDGARGGCPDAWTQGAELVV